MNRASNSRTDGWDSWIFPYWKPAVVTVFEKILRSRGLSLQEQDPLLPIVTRFQSPDTGIAFSYFTPDAPLHTTVTLTVAARRLTRAYSVCDLPLWFALDDTEQMKLAELGWKSEESLVHSLTTIRDRYITPIALPLLGNDRAFEDVLARFEKYALDLNS